jgi:uncharacterized membrane protein YeaQ/YmgE (transglycosylase-associated protein family)
MTLIAWIVVGLIAGAVARMLVPGNDDLGGFALRLLLGIAGAIIGGFTAVALNLSDRVEDFNLATIVLAVLGSTLVLLSYHVVLRRYDSSG